MVNWGNVKNYLLLHIHMYYLTQYLVVAIWRSLLTLSRTQKGLELLYVSVNVFSIFFKHFLYTQLC